MNSFIDRFSARVRASFTREELDQEFDAELTHHLELLTEENIQRGLSPDEAKRQASISLGGAQQLRETHRRTRTLEWMEDFLRDAVHACRLLRKERGFALIALLILTVGIGLNTTVFSLVNTVVLRAMPFAQADRLVWITNGEPGTSRLDLSGVTSSIETWEELAETNQSLEKLEGFSPFTAGQTYRLTGERDPENVTALEVTPGLFDLLGIKPAIGRSFLPADSLKNAPLRAILSYSLWKRLYNADPRIVGQNVRMNDQAVEIVGVMGPTNAFTSVFFPAVRIDLFRALPKEEERGWGNVLSLIGRVKPGVNIDLARADLVRSVESIKKKTQNQYFYANVAWLHDYVSGSLRRPLFFLWIAAGVVLAIVTLNLGSLLLARGAVRGKELALRLALGANRGRIIRQLISECFVLVVSGAILGTVLSWAFIRFLSTRTATDIPLMQDNRLDIAALGFTLFIIIVATILCGVLPACKTVFNKELGHPLRESGRGSSGNRSRAGTRAILLIIEIALACTLAISAALVVHSFTNLLKVDLGFTPRHLIAVRVDLVNVGAPGQSSVADYLDNLLNRVRALPGVEQAAATDSLPVEHDRSWSFYPINPGAKEQNWMAAHVRLITEKLFTTLQTPLLSGRDFSNTDSEKTAVAIINQSLATACWPRESAIGHQLMVYNQKFLVIGVVGDIHHNGPEFPSGNEIYFSLRQVTNAQSLDVLVRTPLTPAALKVNLGAALREFDPTLPLTKIRTMDSVMERTLSSRKMLVSLIVGFATIAVLLALIGLYGVISYLVTQQTKEIGIRMALGAAAGAVQSAIVARTTRLAVLGLALGSIAAALTARSFQSILFGIDPFDASTYLITVAVLLVCALLAGYIPARRASRVDPLISLRVE